MSDSNFPLLVVGARINPPNRFEATHRELDLEQVEDDDEYLESLGRPATEYLAGQVADDHRCRTTAPMLASR